MDDHSRFVTALMALEHEREVDMLEVLFGALLKYPKPTGVYLDNGACYSGDLFALICKRLEIRLGHAEPYAPRARGLQERFWRTLRSRCLDHLPPTATLHDVNLALWAFPVTRIAHVEDREPTAAWLVEGLWGEQAVGFIGAAPKTGKTWLALEMAVAVATGKPCLGHFRVPRRGPVLLFAAEDTQDAKKRRVKAIAAARAVDDFERLAIGLLSVPELRLDRDDDLRRLDVTLAQTKPRLLVLDPLVRLHRGDENSAAEVSTLLEKLRILQRLHSVAIALVHHMRKTPSDQPGQALRGSGDLHAWSDSSLYLFRQKDGVELRAEHRSQPAPEPVLVELAQEPAPHLRLIGARPPPDDGDSDLDRRIMGTLAKQPLTRTTLRELLGVRNETLGLAIARLEAAARVRRSDSLLVPVPAPWGAEREQPPTRPEALSSQALPGARSRRRSRAASNVNASAATGVRRNTVRVRPDP